MDLKPVKISSIITCFIVSYLLLLISFTVEKENYPILVRFFTLFVFTKIFEHIVTVEGEDFLNKRTEKECYKLVEKSIKFQYELISVFISAYKSNDDTQVKHYNKRMRKMLKAMRKSLKEELGSVNKDFLNL